LEGKTVSQYQILDKIGSGGMGVVYKAYDTKLQRFVALKFLPETLLTNMQALERFFREARTASNLNHPNICTIHDIKEYERQPFIVMEFLEGCTLKSRLNDGPVPPPEAVDLAIQVAEALIAAHESRIVHRDIKPTNIFLSKGNRVKLLDFGLAKHYRREDAEQLAADAPTQFAVDYDLTEPGRVAGTVAYMSPEQVEDQPVDGRSDLFSFGVVLYEMLSGRHPFASRSVGLVFSSILNTKPVPLTESVPDFPPQLDRILAKLLEKNPAARYQNAGELRADLLAIKDGGRDPTKAATAARRVSRPGRAIFLGACGVGVVAVLGWLAVKSITLRDVGLGSPSLITQLTTQNGAELSPSLSPDGNSFVYASAASGNWDIYFQRVGGKNTINLTADNPADDAQPAFSPNGEYIAFRSERNGGGIYVMGATGESVRRITDFGYNPAWSPDGAELVLAAESMIDRPNDRYGTSTLWVVNVASGRSRNISAGDAVQPSWSPHGQRIAYWSSARGARNIWTINADGSNPVPVTSDSFVNWNPVWSPDGKYIYFSSDRGGNFNLWRASISEASGKVLASPEIVTAAGGSGQRQHVTFSRDGQRLAYVEELLVENIQKVTFDPANGRAASPVWIVRRTASAINPDPSPDGASLAYQSWGRQENIFVIRNDGTGEGQLTNGLYKDRVPRWSPDGNDIAFFSNRSGIYQIWLIHPDGSGLRQLTNDGRRITRAVWSPDAKRIAGQHFPGQKGEVEDTFIIQVDDPKNREVLPPFNNPNQIFNVWSWSPDGKWLAGQIRTAGTGEASGLALYSVANGRYETLTDLAGDEPAWLDDNRRLLFVHDRKLKMIDRITKVVSDVLSAAPDTVYGVGSLTKDSRTIYLTVESQEADVWMMLVPSK